MKYADYTEEELILDESFQNWVWKTKAEDIIFWNDWLYNHPGHISKIENARQMLLSLKFPERSMPEAEVSQAWTDLQTVIRQQKESRIHSIKDGKKLKRYTIHTGWYRIAAVVITLLISTAIYWLNREQMITHHTRFGETAAIALPDGSKVILNGNTSLRYPADWSLQDDREVWLDGEAFFAVTKKRNAANAKFIVHIPDMQVEVLGTKFNVYQRKRKARVVLNCGQVKININKPDGSASLMMKPGELVELSDKNKKLIKRTVNAEVYSSWKNNRLIFDNTSLAEIAEMIETTYGMKITFQDNIQPHRKLTGTIPTDNPDVLLIALSKSFNLSVTKRANQVIIRPSEEH